MSFQEKNFTASLVTFVLILGFYLIRLFQIIQGGNFNSASVIRLWGFVIAFAVVGTILVTIFTHILSVITNAIKTSEEDPKIEDIQDERDQLINLRGTKVTYSVSSIGVFTTMLTFAFVRPPLVMFSLLIFFGIFAQIVGDISRLVLYRRGF
ncbi:MAG: hypothetical protein ACK2U1_21630 [Anaerolineales bacterium]